MKKNTILQLFFLMLVSWQFYAQEAVTVAGTNAVGTNGSVSYSIGQITYTTQGTAATVAQGVQQPYEISVLSGSEYATINARIVAYPNPTMDRLTIAVSNTSLETMQYQLWDLLGRNILEMSITGPETIVNMDQLPSSTYLLKIQSNHQEIKTFKIIKN